ncbi:MAG: tetratricopeptide repeat protein [Elusimicrobiota bacterium]
MNRARRWMLVTAHFLCPLLFFTNLTRNPYVSQIALLNAALALAFAAWVLREGLRAGPIKLPRLPVEWPLAVFIVIWGVSWLRAYFGHVEFFQPAMAAEGARGGMFLLLNGAVVFWLAATVAAEDDGSNDAPLGAWAACVVVWALLWTAYPQMRVRSGGRPDVLLSNIWDPYGACLWAVGLAGASWLCRRGRLIDYLHLILATGFLASAYGVGQYFNFEIVWPTVLNPYGGRAVSTFGNPNFLSTYTAALMPSALALCLLEKPGPRRWIYGIVFFTLEAALLATLTRSSWGGAAVGVLALGLSSRIRAKVKEEPRTLGLIFGVAIALAVGWPSSTISSGYTPTFLGRLTEFRAIVKAAGFYSPWHQRVLIWTSSWLMGCEEPLLGKGGGLYELFYPFYQGHLLHENPFFHNMRTHANNAHNELLEVFAQTGVIGLGAFIWLWTSFFQAARRWSSGRPGLDPIWIGAVGGVAAVLVDNLLNVSLHFAVPSLLFWWLAGVAMGRGAREGLPLFEWPASTAVRRVVAGALVSAALYGVWWQVRFWEREAWYFAGFKLIRQGNVPAAQQALVRSRAWGPREVNAIYELGNVYARSGRPQEAADAYLGALRANTGYDEIYFNLGTIYAAQLGQTEKGRAYYETAWALNPLSNETINALSAVYLRDPTKNAGRASALLAEAARIFPGNANHWNNLGYALSLQKRWAEAEAAYVKALELMPESPMMERNLEALAAQSGRPRAPILNDLAQLRAIDAAAAKGVRSAELLRRIADVAQRRPGLLMARFIYGSLLLADRRPGEAVVELEHVVATDGRRASPRINLGNAYLALGKPAEAEAQFRAVLAVEPGHVLAREQLRAMGRTP